METTLGIDLASQAANTALCVVAWGPDRAEVRALACGTWDGARLDDAVLVDAMLGRDGETPAKVGIDAPFGWPEPFVRALEAHHRLERWPSRPGEERGPFERRATDAFVRTRAKKVPLSVSTDRIAYPAMRCAALLGELRDRLGPEAVARDGAGLVAEAYPDAALRGWLPNLWVAREGSYKGSSDAARARRERLVETLLERLGPRFAVADARREQCHESDDCLDALVCALLARAVRCGWTIPPGDDEERRLARIEGWIHLPIAPLDVRSLL
jgi:uncharacterized protein DUF429